MRIWKGYTKKIHTSIFSTDSLRPACGSSYGKMHEHVRKEAWGYAKDENLTIPELLIEKYQGIRPAVGYPSLPDQSVNFLLDELLNMKQIGIKLTENGAMYPHASVCGLMFAHPASEYFSIGKSVKISYRIMPVAEEKV